MDEKEKDRVEERKLRERDLVAIVAAIIAAQRDQFNPDTLVEDAIRIRDAANKKLSVS